MATSDLVIAPFPFTPPAPERIRSLGRRADRKIAEVRAVVIESRGAGERERKGPTLRRTVRDAKRKDHVDKVIANLSNKAAKRVVMRQFGLTGTQAWAVMGKVKSDVR